MLSLIKVTLVLGETVGHRETVEAPGLSPGPCSLITISLSCLLGTDLTGLGIIINDMIGAVIRTEMVLEGLVGMADRDLPVGRVS